jgi:NADH-quinone oxidoreductase subunit H
MGLLQPMADAIKLMMKEDITPTGVDRTIFYAAPMVTLIPAIVVFSVIPFGTSPHHGDAIAPNVNVGLLFAFAAMSLSVYGVVLAGWASNNKYSLLGALRSSAQMISYELALGLSVIGVIMLTGSLNLIDVIHTQQLPILPHLADNAVLAHFKNWFIFKQPIGFIIYIIAALAETARIPFDLPEAEGELVAGFHTEYSSFKFAIFFMSEYAFVVAHSCLATCLFLGGWSGPLLPGAIWFIVKVFAMIFFFMWVRATLPRFRYDQLMNFGWKALLPIALVNMFLTGVGILVFQR